MFQFLVKILCFLFRFKKKEPPQLPVSNDKDVLAAISNMQTDIVKVYQEKNFSNQSIRDIAARIIQDLPKRYEKSSTSTSYLWFEADEYGISIQATRQVVNYLCNNQSLKDLGLIFEKSGEDISIKKEYVERFAERQASLKTNLLVEDTDFEETIHKSGIYR